MNRSQKTLLRVVLVLGLVMGLFPPWQTVLSVDGIYKVVSLGYAPIFAPPQPEGFQGVRLDYARLVLQFFILVFAGSILMLLLRQKKGGD